MTHVIKFRREIRQYLGRRTKQYKNNKQRLKLIIKHLLVEALVTQKLRMLMLSKLIVKFSLIKKLLPDSLNQS